jgi:hypothetical protein
MRGAPSTSGNPKLSALFVLNEQRAINYVTHAFRDNDGEVEATARQLLVTKQTLYKWMKIYPALKTARDRVLHDVEERRKRGGDLEDDEDDYDDEELQ